MIKIYRNLKYDKQFGLNVWHINKMIQNVLNIILILNQYMHQINVELIKY